MWEYGNERRGTEWRRDERGGVKQLRDVREWVIGSEGAMGEMKE